MKRKAITRTSIMISNLKNLVSPSFMQKLFSFVRLKCFFFFKYLICIACLLAPCPYVQMEPNYKFGMWKGEEVVEVGTCGENGYFNDTNDICTCTEMTGK